MNVDWELGNEAPVHLQLTYPYIENTQNLSWSSELSIFNFFVCFFNS